MHTAGAAAQAAAAAAVAAAAPAAWLLEQKELWRGFSCIRCESSAAAALCCSIFQCMQCTDRGVYTPEEQMHAPAATEKVIK